MGGTKAPQVGAHMTARSGAHSPAPGNAMGVSIHQCINLYGRRHRGVACTWCPCALQTSPLDAGSLARHLIFTTNLAENHLRSSICFNIIPVPYHNVRRRMGCSYRSTTVTSAASVAPSVARLKGKEGLRLLTGEAYRNDGTR